jgi:uncharacterized protein YkwD
MPPTMRRAAILTTLALALCAPASATARPAGGCARAGALPGAADLSAAGAATLCLLNRERARHGLRALRSNRRLVVSAARHSQDMVERGYFSHETPGGTTFVARILASGYARSAGFGMLGENIAWGTGPLGTPAGIVRAWMNSPGHRANILRRAFRDIGVGIASGVPAPGDWTGATYTTDFGALR